MLSLKNLNKQYENVSAVKNISFEDFSKITTKNFFNLFGKLN